MVGFDFADVRRIGWTALCLVLLAGSFAKAEPAAPPTDCPGHPDAIGTSRTLVVDPRAHPRIGSMQYPETLPLADHEIVLTFDDGPLPKYSNRVLQTLADNCAKATFFIIGQQARANPEGVRKLVAAGHTVGTHSQDHPLTFHKMSEAQAKDEVDQGIESTKAAMTDPSALAPFFRVPGLLRAPPVEAYLETQGIQTWSADFLADDWHHISPAKEYDLAIKRIEARGRGILLLHDIHDRTATALPKILHELKARGYRIVHVVPSSPTLPATPSEPEQWLTHPSSEYVATVRWPKLPNFVYGDSPLLPVPAAAVFDLAQADTALKLDRRRDSLFKTVALPVLNVALMTKSSMALSIPSLAIFDRLEKQRAWLQPFPVQMHHYAEGELPVFTPVKTAAVPRGRRGRMAHQGGRTARHVAHAAGAKSAGKRQAAHSGAAPKRAVHVAALKKRRT